MKKFIAIMLTALMIAALVPAAFASAAGDLTLYIGDEGNDANAGTSKDKPIKTFAKAAELATNSSTLKILVLPENSYEFAAADSMPEFPCPTTIESADRNSMSTLKFSTWVDIKGELTLDYLVVESNYTYIFHPRNGSKFVFGANNDLVKLGNYNWIFMNKEDIADVTVLTGDWSYLYCTGKLTVGGDASTLIANVNNAGGDADNAYQIPATELIIDTTGTIGQVFGTGMGGNTQVGKSVITIYKGTVTEFYCGGHQQTSGGVAYDYNKLATCDLCVANICGGDIVGFFTRGTWKNNYSDGETVKNDPKAIEVHVWGDAGKASYEAATKEDGTTAPVFHKESEPVEDTQQGQQGQEGQQGQQGQEGQQGQQGGTTNPPKTGDEVIFIAVIAVISLAGAFVFAKKAHR